MPPPPPPLSRRFRSAVLCSVFCASLCPPVPTAPVLQHYYEYYMSTASTTAAGEGCDPSTGACKLPPRAGATADDGTGGLIPLPRTLRPLSVLEDEAGNKLAPAGVFNGKVRGTTPPAVLQYSVYYCCIQRCCRVLAKTDIQQVPEGWRTHQTHSWVSERLNEQTRFFRTSPTSTGT